MNFHNTFKKKNFHNTAHWSAKITVNDVEDLNFILSTFFALKNEEF